jgi:hypothetical protein
MATETEAPTVQDVLTRMDEGWQAFRARVHALPGEALQAHLGGGGWTRKQMLGHITTWHDLTVERLSTFASTGEVPSLDEEEDAINARAARAAEGRTAGEVLQSMDDSFARLRREVARLSGDQLASHDLFAAAAIAGNSYGHYAEHMADLDA